MQPAQSTQPKSKVTKPVSRQDTEHRRSVSLQASSSKQRPEDSEQSEGELWRERETRTASDRFGKDQELEFRVKVQKSLSVIPRRRQRTN
jgi:hypothetical protein